MHTIPHPCLTVMGQHWWATAVVLQMRKYSNEWLHEKRVVREWLADVLFLAVIAGVIAAIVYLGFLI